MSDNKSNVRSNNRKKWDANIKVAEDKIDNLIKEMKKYKAIIKDPNKAGSENYNIAKFNLEGVETDIKEQEEVIANIKIKISEEGVKLYEPSRNLQGGAQSYINAQRKEISKMLRRVTTNMPARGRYLEKNFREINRRCNKVKNKARYKKVYDQVATNLRGGLRRNGL